MLKRWRKLKRTCSGNSKKAYKIYLKTRHWKRRRRLKLKLAGYICECCGEDSNLQIHHKNYGSLFNEKDVDLLSVCEECHKKIHKGEMRFEDYAPWGGHCGSFLKLITHARI